MDKDNNCNALIQDLKCELIHDRQEILKLQAKIEAYEYFIARLR